jgi:hypothetical protein
LLARLLFPLVGSVALLSCWLGCSFPLLPWWLVPLVGSSPVVGSVALSPCCLGGLFPLSARWLLPLVGSVALSPCWLGGSSLFLARWLLSPVSSVAPSSCLLGGSFPLLARWLFPLLARWLVPPTHTHKTSTLARVHEQTRSVGQTEPAEYAYAFSQMPSNVDMEYGVVMHT